MSFVGPAGLSSDSGLGGSTDGSTDILVFGSVVDSVTEEGGWKRGEAASARQDGSSGLSGAKNNKKHKKWEMRSFWVISLYPFLSLRVRGVRGVKW